MEERTSTAKEGSGKQIMYLEGPNGKESKDIGDVGKKMMKFPPLLSLMKWSYQRSMSSWLKRGRIELWWLALINH